MDIEIHIAGWSTSDVERATPLIEPMIRQVLQHLSIEECRLARLVIVDDANYGAVIDRLSPGEGFTKQHGMVGVGKTLSFRDAQGSVSNCIVIHANMMNALIESQKSESRPNLLDLEWQRALYVLPHELGHCRDNVARPWAITERSRSVETVFKIRRLNEVSAHLAISEYAACYYSARSVSPALLLDEFNEYGDWCRKVWAEVHARRQQYSGPHDLFDLAVAAGSAAWLTLTQVCKILGLRMGSPELSAQPLDWTQWLGVGAGEALRTAEPLLAERWTGYPNQLDAFQSHLIDHWWKLTRNQGFDFREGASGDGVFFNQ